MKFVQSTQHEYFRGITVLRNVVLQLSNEIQPGIFQDFTEVAHVAKTNWNRMTDVCLFLMTWKYSS